MESLVTPSVNVREVQSVGSTRAMEEQPRQMVRSAIHRLRQIADQLEVCVDLLAEPGEGTDDHACRTVADAATHVRLTAEALEFTLFSRT